jgi:hypothetical protein
MARVRCRDVGESKHSGEACCHRQACGCGVEGKVLVSKQMQIWSCLAKGWKVS